PPYPIFITQSAFAAVQAHAEAKPLDTASLGFLAGNLFRCPETDAPYVVIESAIQLPWSISGDRLRPALSQGWSVVQEELRRNGGRDRKSTRLNSSHVSISYAVFCLKKKKR